MLFWPKIKRCLSLFIPKHINDPIGLTTRLWASEQRSARFALLLTGLGILLSPLDWLISFFERSFRQSKGTNQKNTNNETYPQHTAGPHIFICGPARSGTTLVYQVLADQLDVAYTSNRATLFPRSRKLTIWLRQLADKNLKPALSDRRLSNTQSRYQNYYGKTSGFSAPNEANALWNQWVEPDNADYRTVVTAHGMREAAEYYSLLSNARRLPTLAKNNNANVFAKELLAQLPNSYFICMRRDSRYLAQSLIRARIEINGDIRQSYGVIDTADKAKCTSEANSENPYADVLDQIEFLDALADRQQQHIGPNRFWIIDYEMFCDDPIGLINRVRTEILGDSPASHSIDPITSSNKVTNSKIFERITAEISHRATNNKDGKPNPAVRTEYRLSDTTDTR